MFSGVDFKTLEGIPFIPQLFFDFKSVAILLISGRVVWLKQRRDSIFFTKKAIYVFPSFLQINFLTFKN